MSMRAVHSCLAFVSAPARWKRMFSVHLLESWAIQPGFCGSQNLLTCFLLIATLWASTVHGAAIVCNSCRENLEVVTEIIIDGAFSDCTALQRETIGNTLTCIGQSAFHGSTTRSQVIIGSSVATICSSAFLSAHYSLKLRFPAVWSPWVTVCLPTADHSHRWTLATFAGCTSLSDVTVGNHITAIGAFAFAHGISLTQFTVGPA